MVKRNLFEHASGAGNLVQGAEVGRLGKRRDVRVCPFADVEPRECGEDGDNLWDGVLCGYGINVIVSD